MTCTNHEWVVFSTCLGTHELMLECAHCGAFGVVPDPTFDEWSDGFFAPSNPYLWTEAKRVVIKESPFKQFQEN